MSNDLSQDIKNRLLNGIQARFGTIGELRVQIHGGNAELLNTISQFLDTNDYSMITPLFQELPAAEIDIINTLCNQSSFRSRIKQIALETVYGEQLCPPLKIIPDLDRLNPNAVKTYHFPVLDWRERWIHAILVEYLPNVCNEIYPLMIDAYVHDLSEHENPRIAVVCSHYSWLDDSLRLTRGICFDEKTDDIVEIPFTAPISVNSVQFLCVSPQLHQKYSHFFEDFKCFQVNPYPASCKADNKFACYQCWKEANVTTPDAVLIKKEDCGNRDALSRKFADAFERFFTASSPEEITLIVQPNTGTEGRGTRAFTGSSAWPAFRERHADIIDHGAAIARYDDVLLRRGVGNLLFLENPSAAGVFFDLRFTVAGGLAESGFLMAAREKDFISSPGGGGRIVELKDPLNLQFVVKGTHLPFKLDDDHWEDIVGMAECAAVCVPECKLVGVDIRLEWNEGKNPPMIPYVLDINPRPAGLAHSRFLDTGETGVTQRLWDYLF
ncbi:MAG: hypothetical protein C4527_19215 [Candidatus Omnitrophota bacterium]|jgi:hypothetical protein|nr:MAG: hypothetical protein C4527_19215 [Candidatus Omnitrophota bacterium]